MQTFKETLDIALKIGAVMGTLGLFFGGLGYVIQKYKGGSKEEKAENADLISSNDQIKQFYKEQNDELKDIIKAKDTAFAQREIEWNGKFNALTKEVGELKGQLTAENKQKEQYLAILQNRDPETKQFNEYMIKAVENQTEANRQIVKLLGEIHTMTKDEHDRDFQVTSIVTKDHTH